MRWSIRLVLASLVAVLTPMVAVLWLVAPDSRAQPTQGVLWTGIITLVLLAGVVAFALAWILSRRVPPLPLAGSEGLGEIARAFDEMSVSLARWRQEAEHKTQELEALKNAQLSEAAARRVGRMRSLAEMGRILVSTFDMDQILDTLATRCRDTLDFTDVGIFVLDEEAAELRYLLCSGFTEDFKQTHRLQVGEGVTGRAVAENRPIWTTDILSDTTVTFRPETRARLASVGSRAALAVPLSRRRPFGALVVNREPGYRFTDEDVEFLSSFANQVAVALDNARLYAELREGLRETQTLLAVAQALSLNLPTQEAMRRAAREVARAFGADMVGAYFLDAAKEALVPMAGYHVPKELLAEFLQTPFPLSRFPILQEGFRTGRPVWSANAMSDPRFDLVLLAGIRPGAVLLAPTPVRGEIVGGLFLVWWAPGRTFAPAELRLMEGVASQVGLALENADLARQTQEKLRETETLLSVSRAVSSTLDLQPLLRHFLRQVARTIECDSVGVWLTDPTTGWLEPVAGYRIPPYLLAALRQIRIDPEESPFYAEGFRGKCAQVSTNVPEDHRIPEPLKAAGPHQAQLFAPIVAKDRVIGAFIAVWWERTPKFSERELALIEAMGDQAGVAVENARLFEANRRGIEELAAAQDQLIRTEKLRALGEMASGVAHDFNNLLSSILGRTQLLLRRVEDPKLQQWLRVIERAATDGARTVRRVQEFARIRRDQLFVAVDLNRVVQEALEVTQSRWQQQAQSQGVTVEVSAGLASVPPIAGDPAELREVLTNVILNAVDAMPNGGSLSITTRDEGSSVVLIVRDTGVGISPEVQSRIFDPFFTTKGPKGTGLGLSITYGIVARHRGQISVESREGQGTTFSLTFPASPGEREPGPSVSLQGISPMRCLVVDDEQPVLDVLGDVLATGGHSALLLSDGTEAITRFRAEPFDIVLTDLAMPGVNGWQVARAVKNHAPAVPVLLITGWGVELSPEALKAHGVDAVLSKPVKLDDILAAVGMFCSGDSGELKAQGEDQP